MLEEVVMIYNFVPYLWISLVLIIILISLIIFAWKRRSEKGGLYFLLTLFLSAVWVASQAMEIATTGLSGKIIWANILYIPSTLIPVTYFFMALHFTRMDNWLKIRWLPHYMLIIPISLNLLLWTNDYHGLIWQNVYLDTSGLTPVISKTYGPFFWVYAIYNIILTIITLLILIRGLNIKNRLQRAQALALFMGLLLPACSVCLYITKIFPFQIDPTPMTIGISSIIISWSIFKYHLFDIISIAHSMIIKEMSTGMIIFDNEGEVLEINPAAQNMLNIRLKQQFNNTVDTILEAYPRLIEIYNSQVNNISEIVIKNQTNINYYEVSCKQLSNSNHIPIGWILQIYDITQRKLEEEVIKEMATHDALTGLINRACFEKMFIIAKEDAQKAGTALAIAYLDLDDFKMVNDTYGHDVGDIFLREAADRLKDALKESAIISRYGGDELAILFPSIEGRNTLNHIYDKICNGFERCIEYNDVHMPIKASIGFSIYPADGDNLDLLIKKADKIMYEIKRSKKAAKNQM